MPKGSKLRDPYMRNEKYIKVLWSESELKCALEYDEELIEQFLEGWKEEHGDEEPVNASESCYGFLGSDIRRNTITKVTFTDDMRHVPEHAWDASEDQDQSVMAWTENVSENGWVEVVIAGKGGVYYPNDSLGGMFLHFDRLREVRFNGAFDTSLVTCASGMFEDREKLEKVDMTGLDFSRVTNMERMFMNCRSLKQIDLREIDTGNVTNIASLFHGCWSLEMIDIANMNTGNVTKMSGVFYGCRNLKNVDLSGWDTHNVTSMASMFYCCGSLKELDVSHFDTGKVELMQYMFASCSSLQKIDVSNFDTNSVHCMNAVFMGCSSLKKLNLRNFNTSKVYGMQSLFSGCRNLKYLDISSFDTTNVKDMREMFSGCESLRELDIRHFDMTEARDRTQFIQGDSSMFYSVKCPIKKPDLYGCLKGKRIPFGISSQTGSRFYWIAEDINEFEIRMLLDGSVDEFNWRFEPDTFSEEERRCVTFTKANNIPNTSKVRPEFLLVIRKAEEIPGFLKLAAWLSWRLDEFAFPSLDGKAREYYSSEISELERERFFEALKKANEETKSKFYVPLYELLKLMAEKDDVKSIERILSLCPELSLTG